MSDSTWLSTETFEKLTAELEHMSTVTRAEIGERIESARAEGDLSENGGYHAAREDQAKLEGRIQELKYLLDHAEVGDAPKTVKEVVPGSVVTVSINGRERRFLLGSREAASFVDVEVFPEGAPLGQAILGLKKGDKTTYKAPSGKELDVTVVNVEPFNG